MRDVQSVRDQFSEGTVVNERSKQAPSTRANEWPWVDRTIWTDRMLAALDNGVRGGKWFSLIDKVYRRSTLEAAWEQVRANAGAAGVDGQSIARFEASAPKYLAELAEALEHDRYRPQAVRRVELDKPGGGTRPLGIPTVKDRIVQTAVKRVIEPIFEHAFCPTSYGFRPGRGAKDALREVDALIRDGYTHVVDVDLEQFFDRIERARLMERVEERISDGRLLSLLARWLEQDIVHDAARWTPTRGTPQGAVISPLLANVYLHPLDALMASHGYRMVRYADDCAPRRRSGFWGKVWSHLFGHEGESWIQPRWAWSHLETLCRAALEMRAGPSKPLCRQRLETTHCCCL